MKCNVGGVDKTIRIVVGLVIIAAGLLLKSWWGLVGVILLMTGLVNFCLLYVPFKINTAKKNQ